jgi:hypothetical protein
VTSLDLAALAALRPRAVDLARRIRAGDLEACFDAEQLIAEAAALTEAAHAYVHRIEVSTYLRVNVADAVAELEIGLSGGDILQEALDNAREGDWAG